MSTAEQANADFYYRLGAETQLEAVGEDDLDAHISAPIFAELQRDYWQDPEAVRDVVFEASVWDRFEDVLTEQRAAYVVWLTALVLGVSLGFIGWLMLVSAS